MKELTPSRLNRDDWLEFFRGWKDAAGIQIIKDNEIAKILAKYMPIITMFFDMVPTESLFWFPPALTFEQCRHLAMGQYDSQGRVSGGWHNFLSALARKRKENNT